MKKHIQTALAVFSLISLLPVQAEAGEFSALLRKKNGKPHLTRVTLNLVDPDRFETEHFKVVLSKEETALPTSSSPELRLRATTVLFHLEQARQYFKNKLASPEIDRIEKITVRLNITTQSGREVLGPGGKFIPISHYQNENALAQYNNALTISGGSDYRDPSIRWGREIWFRPAKEIPLREIMPIDPFNGVIKEVNASVVPDQIDTVIADLMMQVFSGTVLTTAHFDSLVRQAGTFAVLEGSLLFAKLVNRALTPRHYYLDTAMIPEVIQHEYAHAALSEYVPLYSTPATEGVADYFAADMQGSPAIGGRIKKYSPWAMKNGKKPKGFSLADESKSSATSDAVLSLLWGMRTFLGADEATRLVFESRKQMTDRSLNIRSGLTEVLLRACSNVCVHPARDRMSLTQYFASLNL